MVEVNDQMMMLLLTVPAMLLGGFIGLAAVTGVVMGAVLGVEWLRQQMRGWRGQRR